MAIPTVTIFTRYCTQQSKLQYALGCSHILRDESQFHLRVSTLGGEGHFCAMRKQFETDLLVGIWDGGWCLLVVQEVLMVGLEEDCRTVWSDLDEGDHGR